MRPKLKPLDQQVVVVTGASSGIGLCTALMAAEMGARVVVTARSAHTLDVVAEQIRQHGGEAVAAVADVADRPQVGHVTRVALERFGRIDTWVNNAGVAVYGRLDEVAEEDARRMFDINFWGVVNGSLEALPFLRREGGALVNVGSEASESVIPLMGLYTASKHAVKAFTEALRIEVGHLDKVPVSITLIEPTATDTPLPQHARNYMDREPTLPAPLIEPERVALAILDAATGGDGTVRLGMMAHASTRLFKAMPRLAERAAALQAGRLAMDDEPPRFPLGNLFQPRDTGRIHGERRPS